MSCIVHGSQIMYSSLPCHPLPSGSPCQPPPLAWLFQGLGPNPGSSWWLSSHISLSSPAHLWDYLPLVVSAHHSDWLSGSITPLTWILYIYRPEAQHSKSHKTHTGHATMIPQTCHAAVGSQTHHFTAEPQTHCAVRPINVPSGDQSFGCYSIRVLWLLAFYNIDRISNHSLLPALCQAVAILGLFQY